MIFVDTNVLIDVIEAPATTDAEWSNRRFREEAVDQRIVSNMVVVAEVAAGSAAPSRLMETLEALGIEIVDLDFAGAVRSGEAHRRYRDRGGTRPAILADFLIAGHAASIGAALMTRDRRLASYFPDLTLITPDENHHG